MERHQQAFCVLILQFETENNRKIKDTSNTGITKRTIPVLLQSRTCLSQVNKIGPNILHTLLDCYEMHSKHVWTNTYTQKLLRLVHVLERKPAWCAQDKCQTSADCHKSGTL